MQNGWCGWHSENKCHPPERGHRLDARTRERSRCLPGILFTARSDAIDASDKGGDGRRAIGPEETSTRRGVFWGVVRVPMYDCSLFISLLISGVSCSILVLYDPLEQLFLWTSGDKEHI